MIGFAFAGLLLGLILGVYCPVRVPPEYARLLAVAVMAGMDAVLGGVRASLEGNYDTQVFISGFFINGILAAFLCYAGNLIGIDLYLVAVLIFGMRIFQNLGIIRRLYMGK
ncbi:small basic family protein [Phascolarctobacterium succinatutens]|uniref:small basic family protein n=1 Tax=Phascolarctobacterium succinatutens TaxID=626940 RepID=UPI003AF43839